MVCCGEWASCGMAWEMVLAWIFTGYNYFKEAIEQAERYTSDHATWEVENPTLIDRLVKNINMYMKWPFLMMAIVLLGIICVSMIRKHAKITGEKHGWLHCHIYWSAYCRLPYLQCLETDTPIYIIGLHTVCWRSVYFQESQCSLQ